MKRKRKVTTFTPANHYITTSGNVKLVEFPSPIRDIKNNKAKSDIKLARIFLKQRGIEFQNIIHGNDVNEPDIVVKLKNGSIMGLEFTTLDLKNKRWMKYYIELGNLKKSIYQLFDDYGEKYSKVLFQFQFKKFLEKEKLEEFLTQLKKFLKERESEIDKVFQRKTPIWPYILRVDGYKLLEEYLQPITLFHPISENDQRKPNPKYPLIHFHSPLYSTNSIEIYEACKKIIKDKSTRSYVKKFERFILVIHKYKNAPDMFPFIMDSICQAMKKLAENIKKTNINEIYLFSFSPTIKIKAVYPQ